MRIAMTREWRGGGGLQRGGGAACQRVYAYAYACILPDVVLFAQLHCTMRHHRGWKLVRHKPASGR